MVEPGSIYLSTSCQPSPDWVDVGPNLSKPRAIRVEMRPIWFKPRRPNVADPVLHRRTWQRLNQLERRPSVTTNRSTASCAEGDRGIYAHHRRHPPGKKRRESRAERPCARALWSDTSLVAHLQRCPGLLRRPRPRHVLVGGCARHGCRGPPGVRCMPTPEREGRAVITALRPPLPDRGPGQTSLDLGGEIEGGAAAPKKRGW